MYIDFIVGWVRLFLDLCEFVYICVLFALLCFVFLLLVVVARLPMRTLWDLGMGAFIYTCRTFLGKILNFFV